MDAMILSPDKRYQIKVYLTTLTGGIQSHTLLNQSKHEVVNFLARLRKNNFYPVTNGDRKFLLHRILAAEVEEILS